jgi:hypothetical protein
MKGASRRFEEDLVKVIAPLIRLTGFALLGTFVWKFVRRRRAHPVYAPSYEAPYVLERQASRRNPLRDDATAAAADTAQAVATAARVGGSGAVALVGLIRSRRASEGVPTAVPPEDIDEGYVTFEWLVRSSDPLAVRHALEVAGVPFSVLDPAEHEHEDAIVERLEAVGMHLDEEGSSGIVQRPVAKYAGASSPRRLTNALEHVLHEAHTGFIVDASGATLLVDEHRTVGTGVLALLEPNGARLTHGDSSRAFMRAARNTGERQARVN